ncbi:MAG: hypothetical protein WBV89_09460 [Ilumatobacter sp.]
MIVGVDDIHLDGVETETRQFRPETICEQPIALEQFVQRSLAIGRLVRNRPERTTLIERHPSERGRRQQPHRVADVVDQRRNQTGEETETFSNDRAVVDQVGQVVDDQIESFAANQ